MASSLRLGQCLRASNQPVIVKSVPHFRLQNERDVLNLFQSRTPFIRPLIDEIVEPSDPPAIVLKYLDDNILNAFVSKILEALKLLYDNNFVHTGKDIRFTNVQLADCGNTVPADSVYAKDGDLIGGPIWRSPESFGALLITLLYGDNFFLFKPDVLADHDKYESKILQRQCQFFGPFPLTYREICPQETLKILAYIMKSIPPEKEKPFSRISEQEISKPSAAELLQDEWFFGKGT
ncbi:hypothetical protein BDV24DRAFT_155723 [Aspergillus arachidicola]|uniref:Protein kinase domain-containing protein n=1 Tax=Aspergillus arachidicola TaxID=656916 RepID=A0A5N6XW56_9EURO|nr:hypothetical protein BDV24DRAFT_155723 [Aspergillus arachidicola]